MRVSTTPVPQEQWIYIPVPALVSEAALFEAVQAQLEENRQRARQRQRGARYLLQGLVVCAGCQYAYYGKAISNKAAKGKKRDYAYYRCIGTDVYRFGGQRICDNLQHASYVNGKVLQFNVNMYVDSTGKPLRWRHR